MYDFIYNFIFCGFEIAADFIGTLVMKRFLILAISIVGLCVACYFLGKSHAEIKIITKYSNEVIYEQKKKAKIWSTPNANRDILLERMREEIL